MTVASLALFGVYLVVCFAVRSLVQWWRTGDTGFRGISGRPGALEWWAGVLFVLALIAGVAAPVTGLMGLPPLPFLSSPWLQLPAALAAVLGIVATVVTQVGMGTSWRIGVDASERTELVTTGAFAWVRNPVFSAMTLTGTGLAFMTPNMVAIAALTLLILAVELQVRVVEEPYLRITHGPKYRQYAAGTGRFLPGVGREPLPDAAKRSWSARSTDTRTL